MAKDKVEKEDQTLVLSDADKRTLTGLYAKLEKEMKIVVKQYHAAKKASVELGDMLRRAVDVGRTLLMLIGHTPENSTALIQAWDEDKVQGVPK